MQSERRDRWVSAAKVHRQMRMRREISVILTGDGAARAVEVERRSAWAISAGRLNGRRGRFDRREGKEKLDGADRRG